MSPKKRATKKRAARAGNSRDRIALRRADLEQDLRDAGIQPDAAPTFDSLVHVVFHHFRWRLADEDNLSEKAILDACVEARIVADDSPAQIASIRHFQTKIGPDEQEKTVVTFTRVSALNRNEVISDGN